MWGNQTFNSR